MKLNQLALLYDAIYLFSIGKEDHMHKPKVYFHNLGLWGSRFVNAKKWSLDSFGGILKKLGHEEASVLFIINN
jgi:hypothetical protein